MTASPSPCWLGIVRLGLVQTALGAIVVLTTSTLNRIMVVELALPAMIPGALVALHYAVQLLRPRLGHGSDVGGRRSPWIVGGMAVLGLGGFCRRRCHGAHGHRPPPWHPRRHRSVHRGRHWRRGLGHESSCSSCQARCPGTAPRCGHHRVDDDDLRLHPDRCHRRRGPRALQLLQASNGERLRGPTRPTRHRPRPLGHRRRRGGKCAGRGGAEGPL